MVRHDLLHCLVEVAHVQNANRELKVDLISGQCECKFLHVAR